MLLLLLLLFAHSMLRCSSIPSAIQSGRICETSKTSKTSCCLDLDAAPCTELIACLGGQLQDGRWCVAVVTAEPETLQGWPLCWETSLDVFFLASGMLFGQPRPAPP